MIRSTALFGAVSVALIATMGWLLALVWPEPAARQALVVSAVIALVVQLLAFAAARVAAPTNLMAGWGVGMLLRFGALVAYAKPKPTPDPRPRLRKLWADAKPTAQGDIVDTYLRSRGVGLDVYPNTIRTVQSLRYYDDHSNSTFPAMLAMVHDLTGKPVTIHRTYIAPDGSGKAPVEKPRKVACRHGRSPHVRLAPVMPIMGIAEGIESALSAMKLFRTPTWSVLSTYGIETFEPLAEIERLIVFADNDANGTGQKAAYALAVRLSGRIVVEVKFPKEPGADWNDALRRG